jgi:hypothetical protein
MQKQNVIAEFVKTGSYITVKFESNESVTIDREKFEAWADENFKRVMSYDDYDNPVEISFDSYYQGETVEGDLIEYIRIKEATSEIMSKCVNPIIDAIKQMRP